MSDILERIKAEDRLWRDVPSMYRWSDEGVGRFISWYRYNVLDIDADPTFTTTFLRKVSHTEEELEQMWARAMLEGGDGDT